MPISDEISNKIDYKQKYSNLKRKLKILIYENESYSEELRKSERQLLVVNRDKSYLLDRLLHYENIESSTSDSEDTLSSDSDIDSKRKKTTESTTNELQTIGSTSKKKKTTNALNSNRSKSTSTGKPSKPTSMASMVNTIGISCSSSQTQSITTAIIKSECPVMCSQSSKTSSTSSVSSAIDGHMTSQELERHLESRRQPLAMLMPEKTPLTVPVELFSNESSSGLPDEDNNINLKISHLCSQ